MVKKFYIIILAILFINNLYPQSNSGKQGQTDLDKLYHIHKKEADSNKPQAVSEDSLQVLKERLKRMNNKLDYYKKKQKKNNKNIEVLTRVLENQKNLIDSLKDAATSHKSRNTSDIVEIEVSSEYKKAQELFYSKQYWQAAQKFKSLLDNFPEHELAGNFAYWAGESYYGMEAYRKALEYFNLVKQYTGSPKQDDALLMAGQSLLKLGKRSAANEKFDKLLNEFPESEYYNLALDFINP
jgi:tol-pal system protein YbgF